MPPTSFTGLSRVNVLGVGIHATSMEEAVFLSHCLLQSSAPSYVCLTGVHGVMEAQRDSHLRCILNQAALCLPDGMPTVWLGRAQGHRQMARVYGPDYMSALCHFGLGHGYRHFLYGGKPGVAELLCQRLEQRFPGIQIVGTYTPPFSELSDAQEHDLREHVAASGPDVLWVGLSTPKQERFMAEHAGKLNVKLMAGVGAAFDIHAGLLDDSPAWIKASGLQWLDRLRQEPRRLWRRYLGNNPAFIWNVALQMFRFRRFSIE